MTDLEDAIKLSQFLDFIRKVHWDGMVQGASMTFLMAGVMVIVPEILHAQGIIQEVPDPGPVLLIFGVVFGALGFFSKKAIVDHYD